MSNKRLLWEIRHCDFGILPPTTQEEHERGVSVREKPVYRTKIELIPFIADGGLVRDPEPGDYPTWPKFIQISIETDKDLVDSSPNPAMERLRSEAPLFDEAMMMALLQVPITCEQAPNALPGT